MNSINFRQYQKCTILRQNNAHTEQSTSILKSILFRSRTPLYLLCIVNFRNVEYGKKRSLKNHEKPCFCHFPYIRKVAKLEQLLIYLWKQLESCNFLWGLLNVHILIWFVFSIVDLSPLLFILPPNLTQNAF